MSEKRSEIQELAGLLQPSENEENNPPEGDLQLTSDEMKLVQDTVSQDRDKLVASQAGILAVQDRFKYLWSPPGRENLISVTKFIHSHVELFQNISPHTTDLRMVGGPQYEQVVRQANPEEISLLITMRELCEGCFAEIFIVVITKTNQEKLKAIAFSGSADEVTEADIQKAITQIKSEINQDGIERVDFIHTHPDQLFDVEIGRDEEAEEMSGLIIINGLTDRDIRSTDDLQKEHFKNIPVSMTAISENGATYTYQAGQANY